MFSFLKHYLPDNFFRGACDVHCHLLPGVDDGFATAEKSLQALKRLEAKGVAKMILTPHFIDGSPPSSLVPGTLQARTLEWVAISFSIAYATSL